MSKTTNFTVFLCFQFLVFSSNATYHDCSATNSCLNAIKSCPADSDDCTLYCGGEQSCDSVTFNCNTDGNSKPCHIICDGESSCENAQMNINNDAAINTIHCNALNACDQMTVKTQGTLIVNCTDVGACQAVDLSVEGTFAAATIECADFADSCQSLSVSTVGAHSSAGLSCLGTASGGDGGCSGVTVNCTATTNDCLVYCESEQACDASRLICNSLNTCTSNEEGAFEVIGGAVEPTSAPSMAPTIPAALQKYVFIDTVMDWVSAQQHCQTEYESNLASITDAVDFENINVYSNVSSNRWIGLNNYYQTDWQWIDESNCDYVSNNSVCKDDTHWALNQPSNMNNSCAVMTAEYNGMYSNIDCSENHPFLCQLTKRIEYICASRVEEGEMDNVLKRVFESITYDRYVSNRTTASEGILSLYVLNNYWYLTDESNNTIGQCDINGTEFILPTECRHWEWISINAVLDQFINVTFSDCQYSDICIGSGLDASQFDYDGWDPVLRQYEFQYFDFEQNGPVYWSPGTQLYIYPITAASDRAFITNADIVNINAFVKSELQNIYAYCAIDETDQYYVFDILDCDANWQRYNDEIESVDTQRLITAEFNCNPTPYPTQAPTLTPGVNHMRFYTYYASDNPLLEPSFNVSEFVAVFLNATLSVFRMHAPPASEGYIADVTICDVFVDYNTENGTNNNCPFVYPPLYDLAEAPYFAAVNFKIYASPNNLESYANQVISAFSSERSDFVSEMNGYFTNYDEVISFEIHSVYVLNLNESVPSQSPTFNPIIPTKTPTANPLSVRNFIFKLIYTLLNFDAWQTEEYQSFADYLRNATLGTFYEMYTANEGYLSDFAMCAVFSHNLEDTCPYTEESYDESEDTQFTAVAPFQIRYNGMSDSFESDMRDTFQSQPFMDTLTGNMNALLSLPSARRLLTTDFSVIDIEIIDPTETTIVPTGLGESKEVSDNNDDSEFLGTVFQIAFITILSTFAIVIICAYSAAKWVWINHFFRVSALITVAIHVMDMLSDVFFTINVSFDKNDSTALVIFMLSALFILVPIIATLVQLWRHMEKHWLKDDKLRSWLSENTKLLYFVSIITGSSFTAIELFNSNLFGLSQFDMGLSRFELMAYQYKRVYSIVLLENFPQLVLQASYVYLTGGAFDIITTTSIAFTMISIIVTIIAMLVQKQILFNQDLVMIEFDVTGSSVVAKGHQCRNIITPMQEQLSTILGLGKGLVEIVRPYNIPNGLRLHLNIHIVNEENNDVGRGSDIDSGLQKIMSNAINTGQVQASLMDCWKLDSGPFVSNLTVMTKDSRKKKRSLLKYTDGPNEMETQIESNDMNAEGVELMHVEGGGGGARPDTVVPPGTVVAHHGQLEMVQSVSDVNAAYDVKENIESNEVYIDEDIVATIDTIGAPDQFGENNADADIIVGVNTMGAPAPYD